METCDQRIDRLKIVIRLTVFQNQCKDKDKIEPPHVVV